MSASISHELSQPLGAIKTYASNTQLMLAGGQIEEAGENLKNIDHVVERVTRIIKTLRSFAIQEEVENRVVEVVALSMKSEQNSSSWLLKPAPVLKSVMPTRHFLLWRVKFVYSRFFLTDISQITPSS